MNDKKEDLCIYRIRNAVETLGVAVLCLESQHYKDSINRSYYAAFYAIKAVLALEEIDFKRHKDAVAYFNKTYIAKEIFPREMGRKPAEQGKRDSCIPAYRACSRNRRGKEGRSWCKSTFRRRSGAYANYRTLRRGL